jgi:hypothetical protein
LQFERYVLEDMWEMRPLTQSLQKAARLLSRAVMLGEAGQCFCKALVESGDIGGADVLELSKLDVAGDDWGKAPVVGPAKGADPRNL